MRPALSRRTPIALVVSGFTAWSMVRTGLVAAGLLAGVGSALAGRPMATDDASTNPAGTCQVEAWVERAATHPHAQHGLVVAPACGLSETLELAADLTHWRGSSDEPRGRGLALKWVDPSLDLGGWRWGAKLALAWAREPDTGRWHDDELGLSALVASRELSDTLALHANLGHQRRPHAQQDATAYAVALAWTPSARSQVFGEFTGDDRSPPVRTAGARWWLLPETLGLDLTVARQAATARSRVVTVGFGWYGLRF